MKAAILLTCILLCASCKKEENKMRYEVHCNTCSITYSNASANTEQGDMSGFWHYDFSANSGQFVYISAQNSAATGTVSVNILYNGKPFENASSSGAYVIATASGSVP